MRPAAERRKVSPRLRAVYDVAFGSRSIPVKTVNPWRRGRFAVLGALIAAIGCPAIGQPPAQRVELSAGIYRIEAEVARDFAARAQGLMHRRQLPPNGGMLFVFDHTTRHCMWMRNTLIPLAVAFIDEHGTILNIEEMAPETETNHCAAGPARYALEMNAGWFGRRKLAPGSRIGGIGGLSGGAATR